LMSRAGGKGESRVTSVPWDFRLEVNNDQGWEWPAEGGFPAAGHTNIANGNIKYKRFFSSL
jgi:hypothetical protein